jgi:serine/threonine protein kinase
MPDTVDVLAEEFARRLRAGEAPSIEEMARRCPDRAGEVRDALHAVLLMERMKPRRPLSSIPTRLGEFRLIREIGRGGMGVVYEAEQEALGRRVALKVLPHHLVADERLRERFRREAQAAARLHHTNIVPVFGSGEDAGHCYYVMQLIHGRGLDRVIAGGHEAPTSAETADASAPPPPGVAPPGTATPAGIREAARIAAQAADALAHAHALGVLHRDIKPSNILLDEMGTAWVTDFGVAKLADENGITSSGDLVGTLRYMPPERFSGVSDERGDIYSLGVTLLELATRQPAFPDVAAQHLIHLVTHQGVTPPRQACPAMPADLETVILKAAARDPAHRYQKAAELADDLRRFLDGRPVRARRAGAAEQAWRWCRRNPALAASLSAAAVLMLAVTVVSVWAWISTDAANREAQKALASEKHQRQHAEDTLEMALGSLNRIFKHFAPGRLSSTSTTEEGVEVPVQPSLPPEAVALLEELSGGYSRIAASASQVPHLQGRAAEAFQRLGDIRQRLGRLEEAAEAYRSAITLLEVQDPVPREKLARALSDLGRALRQAEASEEGDRALRRAVEILEEAEASTSRAEARFELARALFLLGQRDLLSAGPPPGPDGKWGGPMFPGPGGEKGKGMRGPFGGGKDRKGGGMATPPEIGRAVTLLERLTADYPRVPEYKHLLACCCRETGPSGRKRGVALMRELVAEYPQAPDYVLDLCEALASGPMGPPRGWPGEGWPGPPPRSTSEGREAGMREAVQRSDVLARQYPNVPDYRAAHARYLDDLGMYLGFTGSREEAEKAHKEAFDQQSALNRQHPDVPAYLFALSRYERSYGKALARRGENSAALERLQAAISRAEPLLKKGARLNGVRPFLGMAYADLAEALTRAGKSSEASEAWKKSEEYGFPPFFFPGGGPGGRGPGGKGGKGPRG